MHIVTIAVSMVGALVGLESRLTLWLGKKGYPVSHAPLVIEAGLAPQSIYTKCTFRHIGGEREENLGAEDPVCPWYNRLFTEWHTFSGIVCP